jgi:hypothetical protein
MSELRFTLLADGSSDAALVPILSWLLKNQGVMRTVLPYFAGFPQHKIRPRGLTERIQQALIAFPCELLFIHRDAENQDRSARRGEIEGALRELSDRQIALPPSICVIPIRMTEAWLLFNEDSIRRAAGNPNGNVRLNIPRIRDLEGRPDPKADLYALLKTASELKGRKLRDFHVNESTRRLADLIDDFTPLRHLTAFQELESGLRRLISDRGWDRPVQ